MNALAQQEPHAPSKILITRHLRGFPSGVWRSTAARLVAVAAAFLATGQACAGPQPEKILAPTASASDRFGLSVAVSGDTMVVGAPYDAAGNNLGQGSAHVYRWTGTGWAFEATLLSADGALGDRFAEGVAVSGDTIVVGASRADIGANADQGAAYVFTRSGTSWTQQAKLIATGGAANDQFGVSVGISNSTVVVGAHLSEVAGSVDRGAAYVFSRSGATWAQQAQLAASDGAANDQFGLSVAIDDTTILVGAHLDDVGANADQGSAYVYVRSGVTWSQQAKVTAFDGAAVDQFGRGVAISGNRIAIGAPMDDVGANLNQGSAYVFLRTGTAWAVERVINASDGAAQDRFGRAVAMEGDTLVAGAFQDDVGSNSNQGSIYLFQRSATTWPLSRQYTVSDGAADDQFGITVAISGDTVVAGAPFDDAGAVVDQGSAWVFTRVGTNWTTPEFVQRIALDGAGSPGDQFGRSVAIGINIALIGSAANGSASIPDAVYAYSRSSTATPWIARGVIANPTGNRSHRFGASVAISGTTAVIGAPGADRAYVYVWSSTLNSWSLQAELTDSGWPLGETASIYGNAILTSASSWTPPWDPIVKNSVFVRSGTTWSKQHDAYGLDRYRFDAIYGSSVSGNLGLMAFGGSGRAWVTYRSDSTWSPSIELTPSYPRPAFGLSISTQPDGTIAVGSPRSSTTFGDHGGGEVHVFQRTTPSTWAEQSRLMVSQAELFGFQRFGESVAFSPAGTPLLVVGAPGGNAVFMFAKSGTSWARLDRINPVASTSGDFGQAVAVHTDNPFTPYTIMIGAPGANGKGAVQLQDKAPLNYPQVLNDTRNIAYANLGQAIAEAQAGDTISANSLAFGAMGVIDASARTVELRPAANSDARWPISAALTLGSGSSLTVPPGRSAKVFGSLTLGNGSSLTVPSGRIAEVFGSLNVVGGAAVNINAPVLRLSDASSLTAGVGSTLRVISGDFDSAINNHMRLDLASATLRIEGPDPEQLLEAMSEDVGPYLPGLDRALYRGFPIGTLWIGSAATTVRLVDAHVNGGGGQSSPEAIYTDTLRISAGCRLINPTIKIYYNTLINDGIVDVPSNLQQYTADPCAPFTSPVILAAGSNPTAAMSQDLNGDGLLDAVISNWNSASISVMLGNGDGTFSPTAQYATGGQPGRPAIADLNADGAPDIAVPCLSGRITVLLNNGSGAFTPTAPYGLEGQNRGVAALDVNGDGIQDLVVTRGTFNSFYVLRGPIGSFFGNPVSTPMPAGSSPGEITTCFWNDDALPDVVIASSIGGGSLSVYPGRLNGTLSFGAPQVFAAGSVPSGFALADFTGDGVLDAGRATGRPEASAEPAARPGPVQRGFLRAGHG